MFVARRAETVAGLGLLAVTVALAILIPWALRRHWRLSTAQTALAGLVVGFITVALVWGLPLLLQTKGLAWPWYAPVGAGVTVGVALLLDRVGVGRGRLADRGAQPGLDQPGRADAVAARPPDER